MCSHTHMQRGWFTEPILLMNVDEEMSFASIFVHDLSHAPCPPPDHFWRTVATWVFKSEGIQVVFLVEGDYLWHE